MMDQFNALILNILQQSARKSDLDRVKAAMQAAPEAMQCYTALFQCRPTLVLSINIHEDTRTEEQGRYQHQCPVDQEY